ncbi:hypothetical protein [uncultured Tateyamaria sp.]|nr:hypothetical protein [uncultured Tateyamaria sp.]
MRLIDVNGKQKPVLRIGKAGQDGLEILEALAVVAGSATVNGLDANA